MIIDCRKTDKGLKLLIDKREFELIYPEEIWKNYPDYFKDFFLDNYAFLKTLHLPQMLSKNWKEYNSNLKKLYFKTSYPAFKQQILQCHLNNLSFCADIDNVSTSLQIKNFLDLEINFKDYQIKYPNNKINSIYVEISKENKKEDILNANILNKNNFNENINEKAVVNMSFGKDSLLTCALAKEIGLEPIPVSMMDSATKIENNYKKQLIKKFSKEFNINVYSYENNTGVIHDYRFWNLERTELGYGHLMTELFLNIIPFAFFNKAKFILFGNEKSCDDTYINKEGYLSYPVYDQSSDWMIEMNNMAFLFNMNISSFVEPLYELAIVKILHNRYPEIGKYQMSCFPDENDHGKKHYWCEHCSKCARIYIFMLANNFDPKSIGFRTNMLVKENEHLFSCFNVEKKQGCSVGYDASGCGSEEQLYAFYLAYKNGYKGDLITKFENELLKKVEPRADELKNKYYGIHISKTIPKKFLDKLHKIFKEELNL